MCYVTRLKKIVYHVGNNEKTDHAHLLITYIMDMKCIYSPMSIDGLDRHSTDILINILINTVYLVNAKLAIDWQLNQHSIVSWSITIVRSQCRLNHFYWHSMVCLWKSVDCWPTVDQDVHRWNVGWVMTEMSMECSSLVNRDINWYSFTNAFVHDITLNTPCTFTAALFYKNVE